MLLIFSSLLLPAIASGEGSDTLSAERIIQRAIARRIETRGAAAPFAAVLHTRTILRIESNRAASMLLPAQTVVRESVGDLYRGRDGNNRVRITGRRGTALKHGLARNLVENFQSLGDYISIDDDAIVLLNTAIVSPLAGNASHYYLYRIASRSTRNNVPVYEIAVRPATTLYPAFEGTMVITRATYDVVAIELTPSAETAIPFVDQLRFTETFSPVETGLYQPASFEVSGEGEVRLVAFGVAESHVAFTVAGRLDERRLHAPTADWAGTQPTRVAVGRDADTTPMSFRTEESMLSDEEVDSIEASRERMRPAPFGFSALPVIDYNRAGAVSLGASGSVTYGPATVGGMGGYSFGIDRPIGKASLTVEAGDEESLHGSLHGDAFSQITTFSVGDQSYPRIMNTLVAASLHQDYYNFFRKDGWSIGGELNYEPLRFSATFEQSRQFSIGNNARWSLLTWNSREFQPNPPVTDGSYQTVQAEVAQDRVAPFLKITPVAGLDLRWSLLGLLGKRTDSSSDFRLAEALLSLSFPIVETGYNPMTLTLLGAAGIGTASLPPQYQFRLRTSAASFGKPGGFVSPPKGLYGGTEYLAFGAEINTTDLWWRALGLPRWNGRGIELILAGGSARYRQEHSSGFTGTGDLWYSEAGIALSRIPLFITDLIYGRVDLRQGLGPLGQFGGNFTFVVPL